MFEREEAVKKKKLDSKIPGQGLLGQNSIIDNITQSASIIPSLEFLWMLSVHSSVELDKTAVFPEDLPLCSQHWSLMV